MWPAYFTLLLEGKKQYELRKKDRDFRQRDFLLLREWHPTGKAYTGRARLVQITSILASAPKWGLKRGFCILGIEAVADVVQPRK